MIGGHTAQHHQIGRLVWTVDVVGMEAALRFQARLTELNRTLFLPIIDKVLSGCLSADRHAILARLTLDLGEVSARDFEHAAAAALELALMEALSAALAGLGPDNAGDRILSEPLARIALVRHYLVYGTVPYELDHQPFDAEAILEAATVEQPQEMAAMLRRLAAERQATERLVLQARVSTLRRLLEVLEPAHAELILGYVTDLGRLHHEAPLISLGDRDFARLLWLLTLRFLLDDAGSQFNRKSYLGTVLRNIAGATGIDYHRLLAGLSRGIEAIGRRMPVGVSLPAVLSELLRDAAGQAPRDIAVEPTDGGDAITTLIERDPVRLVSHIRRMAHNRPALRTLIESVPLEILGRLLVLMDREHAPLVQDFLADVTEAHRVDPLVPLAPAALNRLLWVLSIVQLARDSGSQFNRKSFLQTLLRDLADHESVDFVGLLLTLRRGIEQIVQRVTPAGSVVGLIEALLRELAPAHKDEALAVAASYLRTGIWPGLVPQGFMIRLVRSDPAGFAALIRDLAGDEAAWPAVAEHLFETLTPSEIVALLSPDDAMAAEVLTERLEYSAPGDERAAWVALLRRLARGRSLAESTDPNDMMAVASAAHIQGGNGPHHLDRMAALSHLLRTGRLPWWAARSAPPLRRKAMLAAFSELPADQLRQIFAESEPGRRSSMALRLVGLVGEAGVRHLLDRLAPWATNTRGPLAQVAPAERDAVMARLLVAVLEGGSIELGELLAETGTLPIPQRKDGAAAALPKDLTGRALDALLAAVCDPALDADGADMKRLLTALAKAHAAATRLLADRLPAVVRPRLTRLLQKRERGNELIGAVLAFLAGEPVASFSEEVLLEAAVTLADTGDDNLREAVGGLLRQARLRALWVARLPNRLIVRLVRLAEPRRARILIETVEFLGTAWHDTMQFTPSGEKRLPWAALLDFLAGHPRQDRDPRALTAEVVAALTGKDDASAQRLLTRARDLARTAGHAWLPAVLRAEPKPPPPMARRPTSPPRPAVGRTAPPHPAFGLTGTKQEEAGETFHYVGNAGLVLAGPFLPHLFRTLDLLGEDGNGKPAMRDMAAASRAVHLLQWLVDERTDRPEPELLLNKILCGLPPSAAVEPSIRLSEADMTTGLQLLQVVLANWTIISNTSVAGLRETFLQREGRLERRDNGWNLRIARKTVDVLVDQFPFGFSMIFHPWQPEPLSTTW